MLMNAANSGQRRMGTHTLEPTPKRNPLICKANNVLLRLKMPKGSLSAYWGIALSLIRHTIRTVQSYVHTWFNGGTGTGMDLKAKPFSCPYHKLWTPAGWLTVHVLQVISIAFVLWWTKVLMSMHKMILAPRRSDAQPAGGSDSRALSTRRIVIT